MKRDAIALAVFWAVLTAIGLLIADRVRIFPHTLSTEGDEIGATFKTLTLLSVPVIALVIAVLTYSLARFASFSMPEEDGMPLQGRGPVPMAWFGVTAGLAIVTMVVGILPLGKVLSKPSHPDLRINVTGVQWTWLVNYPDQSVNARELVLPVDRVITFNVTSQDVIHSFWIPGLSAKIDSVPGMTTHVSIKTTETGSYATNPMLRVQCSQLCGLGHAQMWMPIRIVSERDFEEWVAQQKLGQPTPAITPGAPTQDVSIAAANIKFDTDSITVNAGEPVHLTFDNQDQGVPHNWALYGSESDAKGGAAPLAGTSPENGPVKQELTFNPPAPGIYYFRCDVHPTQMTGTLIVK
jgi:cytochrome c oxidase subunit II